MYQDVFLKQIADNSTKGESKGWVNSWRQVKTGTIRVCNKLLLAREDEISREIKYGELWNWLND